MPPSRQTRTTFTKHPSRAGRRGGPPSPPPFGIPTESWFGQGVCGSGRPARSHALAPTPAGAWRVSARASSQVAAIRRWGARLGRWRRGSSLLPARSRAIGVGTACLKCAAFTGRLPLARRLSRTPDRPRDHIDDKWQDGRCRAVQFIFAAQLFTSLRTISSRSVGHLEPHRSADSLVYQYP